MPGRDDLDKLIDDLVEHDPGLELRVAALPARLTTTIELKPMRI